MDPSNGWRLELDRLLEKDDQTLREQLGAMVAARKKIAHGDGEQVTAVRALAWSDAALKIGQYLGSLFGPEPH